MNQEQTAFGGKLLGVAFGLVEFIAVQDDFGTEHPGRFDLGIWGESRHHDRNRQPHCLTVVCQRLRMVASRHSNDARANFVLMTQQAIERPTLFERGCKL